MEEEQYHNGSVQFNSVYSIVMAYLNYGSPYAWHNQTMQELCQHAPALDAGEATWLLPLRPQLLRNKKFPSFWRLNF